MPFVEVGTIRIRVSKTKIICTIKIMRRVSDILGRGKQADKEGDKKGFQNSYLVSTPYYLEFFLL